MRRDLGGAAARQHDEDGPIGIETQPGGERRGIERREARALLDQGMPDIGAGRAAQPLVRGRLERQQRQHMIDVARASSGHDRDARPTRSG